MNRPRTPTPERLHAALLTWYRDGARDLPWRRTRDPYAIWVSEVMSQQTRVETVVAYYERWMAQFPDASALADASLDDVLKTWEGLGYYTRARNLHAAAGVVRERYGGRVPSGVEDLRGLPGVGEYTAGAVASIAFDAPVPAVDGNVRRVLARWMDEPSPSPAWLRDAAVSLMNSDAPGEWNQALMELGARICTPRNPRCGRCPVASFCIAAARGTQHNRPAPAARKQLPVFHLATAVLTRPDGDVLVVKRAPTGLLGGLWNFPAAEAAHTDVTRARAEPGADHAAACLHIARGYAAPLGAPVHLGTVKHTFTHRVEHYHCYRVHVTGETATGGSDHAQWIGAERGAVALPRAQQRIHALAFSGVG